MLSDSYRASALLTLLIVALVALSSGLARSGNNAALRPAQANSCRMATADGTPVQHVIYLQFDNTHARRDVSDVPADLEQMPHLRDFLTQNGTLFTNDHTILISHTTGGIVTALTGLYPDRNGQTVSTSYDYFTPSGAPRPAGSFRYWTDPVSAADPLPNMITDGQQTTPAPWVPFTRAGCDVGGVGIANVELEDASTAPTGDVTTVFGSGSPEWNEAADPAQRGQAQADFVGIAVHCAQAPASLCTNDPNARPDLLPDEPGGYAGYQALFGAKYVDPAITGGAACVNDTAGQSIADPAGNCGFPGFDGMVAKNALGYVAAMQESGVPVTFAYLSDAHDVHTPDPASDTYRSRAQGPGEAGFEAQLKAYDDAFAAFFQDLVQHGIDKSNTLFVVTVDEGDHFLGGTGAPQADGTLAYAHTSCADLTACPPNQIGEVAVDLPGLLPAGEPAFDVHADSAPTVYVSGQPQPADPAVRQLERDMGALTALDPYQGGASVPLTQALADPVEEQTLHMANADPARTPTFTLFGNPDFFFQATNPPCGANPCVSPAFAWNHGDVQDEIGNTWVGFVGPGVAANGADATTWTDHTNVRPTMLALLGLQDDYVHDGRVLLEALTSGATPPALAASRDAALALGAAYEQLNAPFGQLAMSTLTASTRALESGSADDDSTYTAVEGQIADLTARRNALGSQIRAQLDAAAFFAQPLEATQAQQETAQAQTLIAEAATLAAQ